MTQPTIIMPGDPGVHNSDLSASIARLEKAHTARDLSTVIVVATRGGKAFTARWVNGLHSLVRPMNQRVIGPLFMEGFEVGVAYNLAIEQIMATPYMASCKYLLCWEDDVIPQPDALLKLYENIEEYDVVGAIYWTKGEGGQPMIYGAKGGELEFRPQVPNGGLHECNGTGMGFTLFQMDQFKKVPKPWFETQQKWDPATGIALGTQDLNYYAKLLKAGGRIAVDCNARAGHLDSETGILW